VEYDEFIHEMNPEAALEGNPNLNLALNQGFTSGSDYSQLLQYSDIVWSEEPNHAAWTEDGGIISKVRSFKAARIMGKSLFVYTGSRCGGLTAARPQRRRVLFPFGCPISKSTVWSDQPLPCHNNRLCLRRIKTPVGSWSLSPQAPQ
jgi:hypothetical protein